MPIYKRFLAGMPEYLARYYWWAYLWRAGIWFFDHQPIINAILFGQYQRLMAETLCRYHPQPGSRTLQLTCVYGSLTPALLARTNAGLHIADVAPQQLGLARRKTARRKTAKSLDKLLYPACMNAECLGYACDSFDTVVLFFLLHEMPPSARENTLAEMLRITRPGGSILITEYGELPERHYLYRFVPFRWLLGRLEPFLPGFWQEDLQKRLECAAAVHGKKIHRCGESASIFGGFYRVIEYRVFI